MAIEFSPERDVSSPADWVNADKTCPDCRRQAPSYNRVPISICTENLTTSQKITIMVITRNRKSPIAKSHEIGQLPKYPIITPHPLILTNLYGFLLLLLPPSWYAGFSVDIRSGKLFPLISFSVMVPVSGSASLDSSRFQGYQGHFPSPYCIRHSANLLGANLCHMSLMVTSLTV